MNRIIKRLAVLPTVAAAVIGLTTLGASPALAGPTTSMNLSLVNEMKTAVLYRTAFGLSGGIWRPGANGAEQVPPEVVYPQQKMFFASESNGAGTGTEGHVTYRVVVPDVGEIGSIDYTWDNPFVGGNTVGCTPTTTNPRFALFCAVDNQYPDGYTASDGLYARGFSREV